MNFKYSTLKREHYTSMGNVTEVSNIYFKDPTLSYI